MNREKLLELADFALTIPQEKFCMSIWKQQCGSAGCLIGHAIAAGLLPGLELAKPEAMMPGGHPHPHTIGGMGDFYESGDWSFGAVARELGIEKAQAEDLFAPDAYPLEEVELDNEDDDPEDHIPREWVAERIREFVARVEAEREGDE